MDFSDGIKAGYVPNAAVSEATHRAIFFLEARGFRFLIDFGYENALHKAHAIWRREQVM